MAAILVATYNAQANADTITISNVVIVAGDLCIVTTATDAGSSIHATDGIDFGSDLDAFSPVPNAQAFLTNEANAQIHDARLSAGTEDIVIHLTAKAQNICGVAVFRNVFDPVNGNIRVQVNESSPTTLVIAEVAIGDIVVDTLRTPDSSITIGADQTAIFDLSAGGEHGGSSTQSGADGNIMTWSFSGTNAVAYAGCRIPTLPDNEHLSFYRTTVNTLLRM